MVFSNSNDQSTSNLVIFISAYNTIGHPTKKTLNKLRDIAREYCDHEGGCHGPDHSLRVENTAIHICNILKARQEIIQPAAILHDIGRREETKSKGQLCHAEIGARTAKKILANNNFSQEDTLLICNAILCHRFRNNHHPLTIEAKIIYDADKLDSIGAIGIGRAFIFAGEIGSKLHNTDQHLVNSKSYSNEDTAYREFKVKMSKIKDKMLTTVGKQLATERHLFMELYFDRLNKEIFG